MFIKQGRIMKPECFNGYQY